jgi:predicted enzyme related to lactoylglutathione lyase
MSRAFDTIIYPVKDLARAKEVYRTLLGTEPYMDQPYYVGFRLDGQEIGLDPSGQHGNNGPINYRHVQDIDKELQRLVSAGAEIQQPVKQVGGGRQIATVRDGNGNVVGLIQG